MSKLTRVRETIQDALCADIDIREILCMRNIMWSSADRKLLVEIVRPIMFSFDLFR